MPCGNDAPIPAAPRKTLLEWIEHDSVEDLLDAAASTHTGVLLGARLSPRDPAADQLVVIAEGLVEGRGNVGR